MHRKCALRPVQVLLVKVFTILNGLTSRMSKGFIVLVLIIWKLLFLTRVMAGILTWQFLLDFKTSCLSDEMRESAYASCHLFIATSGNCWCEKPVRAGAGL